MTGKKVNLCSKLSLWLIRFIGVIVPRRFRTRFRHEWEAELDTAKSCWPGGQAQPARQTHNHLNRRSATW